MGWTPSTSKKSAETREPMSGSGSLPSVSVGAQMLKTAARSMS